MICLSDRAVLAACSRYFEAMFSGGLRESLDSDVNFRDSIHPEVTIKIVIAIIIMIIITYITHTNFLLVCYKPLFTSVH